MTASTLEPRRRATLFARLQEKSDAAFFYLGELTSLAAQTVQQMRRAPIDRPLLMAQFDQIGVRSLSIVIITSAFIGMVLALQTAYALEDFGGKMFVGTIVSLSLVRELAPVLMALMVGGRIGAGMTAEIGTMKVTEQIDAMRALATNPVRKLVVPRVLATTIMFPLLTVIAIALGILGGMFIAVANLNLSGNYYLRSVIESIRYSDLASGVGKTFFFGSSTALIACYNGLRTTGGADGVGRSTTETVVTSAIAVLIMDFFLTKLFLIVFS
jgi:phospholipid/cholesterol/gamma-HCH transport system permease protein